MKAIANAFSRRSRLAVCDERDTPRMVKEAKAAEEDNLVRVVEFARKTSERMLKRVKGQITGQWMERKLWYDGYCDNAANDDDDNVDHNDHVDGSKAKRRSSYWIWKKKRVKQEVIGCVCLTQKNLRNEKKWRVKENESSRTTKWVQTNENEMEFEKNAS